MSLQDRQMIELGFEQGRGGAPAWPHRLLRGLLPPLSCGQLILETKMAGTDARPFCFCE